MARSSNLKIDEEEFDEDEGYLFAEEPPRDRRGNIVHEDQEVQLLRQIHWTREERGAQYFEEVCDWKRQKRAEEQA